jgi:hypothetical protein
MIINRKMPNIITTHIGYFCDSEKICLIHKDSLSEPNIRIFQLQFVGKNDPNPDAGDFETVFEIKLENADSHFGCYLKGDFSRFNKPGLYRVTSLKQEDYSYPFLIHDETYRLLPSSLLGYLHAQRCGTEVEGYHGPCHLDDGIRSDNGKYIDVSGGWHDAGDCRKWMSYTPLPIRGLHRLRKVYHFSRYHHTYGKPFDDVVDEALCGVKLVLKMQDPDTGMIFEDVGGGQVIDKTKPWWFENFSGCAASNQDNRFTDNIIMSGDERLVRVQYNPIVQWTIISLLIEAADILKKNFPEVAKDSIEAAVRCFNFMNKKKPDAMDNWTVVRSWKVSALNHLAKVDSQYHGRLEQAVLELLDNQNQDEPASSNRICGFWYNSQGEGAPYRGPLHSAQPAVSLLDFMTSFPKHKLLNRVKDATLKYFNHYIVPMSQLSPFRIIPYGLYTTPNGDSDRYHQINEKQYFRFFMPTDTEHKITIGLNTHLTSHAHSLALAWSLFGKREYRNLAIKQIEWITGFNPYMACLINGFGFNNPVPHSRFLGSITGGVYNGYIGDSRDLPVLDLAGKMLWNTTEFWNPPLANLMMALSYILPEQIKPENRIGVRKKEG